MSKRNIWNGYKRIKREILKGGVVVAPRRFGKTRALLELLHQDNRYVIMTFNHEARDYLITQYQDIYKEVPPQRIFSNEREMMNVVYKERWFRRELFLLLDEFFFNDYKGPFFAAVSSFNHPLRIVKPSKKQQDYVLPESKHLSRYQAEAQLMLKNGAGGGT